MIRISLPAYEFLLIPEIDPYHNSTKNENKTAYVLQSPLPNGLFCHTLNVQAPNPARKLITQNHTINKCVRRNINLLQSVIDNTFVSTMFRKIIINTDSMESEPWMIHF